MGGAQPKLYLRKLDQTKAVELPGTEGANSPFFLPDGRWAGFSIGGKLFKIALDGGVPVGLSEPGISSGSAWGEDGTITTSVMRKGLVSTPSGGAAAMVLKLAEGEFGFSSPQALPGGKALLFASATTAANGKVEVLSLADHKRRLVVDGARSPRYVATSRNSGYLLYDVNTTMYAVPFEVDRLEKSGAPVAVLDDVGVRQFEQSQFEISRTGTLVYKNASRGSGSTAPLSTIQWVDAAGRSEPVVSKPGTYRSARWSPDGKRLLVGVAEGRLAAAQVYDVGRDTWIPLPGARALYRGHLERRRPVRPVFGSLTGIYSTRADGAGQPEPLMTEQAVRVPFSMTPDGSRLAYTEGIINDAQLWTVPVESAGGHLKAGTREAFLRSAFRDLEPAFSPDGKWLAYMSNLSGVDEVYVRAFPDNGSLWKISNSGGEAPMWSRKTHELLYQSHDEMLAVSWSEKNGGFVPEKPRVWAAKVGGTAEDLSSDGKQLLVLAPVNPTEAPRAEHEVALFQNFLGYLRQHVPAGK